MRTFLLSFSISVIFLAGTILAMRSQRLREQTALLWLGVSAVIVFLSISLPTHLLDRLSLMVGISYGPTLIFLLAVLFLTVLVFHLSIRLDRMRAHQVTLIQELALMRTAAPSSPGEEPPRSPLPDHLQTFGVRDGASPSIPSSSH